MSTTVAQAHVKRSRSSSEPGPATSTSSKVEDYPIIQSILPYMKEFKSVWDPVSGGKEDYPMKKFLEAKGIRVIDTDKTTDPEHDFQQYKTKKRFDAIVTCSPNGARKDFVLRAFEIGKPFAVLVPLSTFESRSFRDVLQKCQTSSRCKNLSIVFPPTTSDSKKPIYSVWLMINFEGAPNVLF